MSATTTARDHLADLIELKKATAEMLIETSYTASVRNAQLRAANDLGELKHFINEGAINVADNTTTGTKPCK